MNHRCSDTDLSARLADMALLCERNGSAIYSKFLDERQCAEAELWCRKNTGGFLYTLWGGFPDAKRKILAIYPDYYEDYVISDFPMKCLTFTYRKEDVLTHRDFLGTFMGLNLKREVIGDIVTGEGKTQAFVTDIVSRLIVSTVSKVGNKGVRITDEKPFEMEIKQDFKIISGTVASMRLDCVVGLATGLSRDKSASLIKSDKVEVNHFAVDSVSYEVNGKDIISIRGFGRFILSEINGSTKKGRIHINLNKFI